MKYLLEQFTAIYKERKLKDLVLKLKVGIKSTLICIFTTGIQNSRTSPKMPAEWWEDLFLLLTNSWFCCQSGFFGNLLLRSEWKQLGMTPNVPHTTVDPPEKKESWGLQFLMWKQSESWVAIFPLSCFGWFF